MNGSELRGLRKAANLTQRQLADKIGIASVYLSRLENGHHPVSKTVEMAALAVCTPGGPEVRRISAKRELALLRIRDLVKDASSPIALRIKQECNEGLVG